MATDSPKALEAIHDLFSTKLPIEDAVVTSDRLPPHTDLYQQLDQLELMNEADITSTLDHHSVQRRSSRALNVGDLFAGLAQLATMGVLEVTEIVESMHREIMLRPLGRYNEHHLHHWHGGMTGRVYGLIRYLMATVGDNVSSGIWLYKNLVRPSSTLPLPTGLKKLVNVLNGVMGDHLVTHNNALALPMVLYNTYGERQHGTLSGRIIILCHGLCLSHLSWQPENGVSLGDAISHSQPDATVLYLDYNTGQRISSNGRQLSTLLQALVDHNPAITQIDLIGYSLGGLVARSAMYYAEQSRQEWIKRARHLITLGSPHHGALLERIGCMVQDIISKVPFANSLAHLADMRSAGIIDLRHGSIRDADWQSVAGRGVVPQDFRHPTQLPSGVKTFFVASALVESNPDSRLTDLVGDSLVSVASALGEHDREHTLFVPEGHKAVFYGVSHLNLIHSRRVREQIVTWLLDNGKSDYSNAPRIQSYPKTVEIVI